MTSSPTDADRPEGRAPSKPEPSEGLRLLKAFMSIDDPKARADVIKLAESLSAQATR